MKKLFFLFALAAVAFVNAKTPIITKWQTYDANIKIRSIGSYKYTWQQVGNAAVSGSGTVGTGVTNTITFPAAGTYTVTITPDASFRFIFNHGTISYNDRYELIELSQWGDSGWNPNMSEGFYSCSNLKITATDTPNFSGVTDMSSMFQGCSSITDIPNINLWNTASVTNMSLMFSGTTNFNANIQNWDVSKVTNMSYMFRDTNKFNSNISSWNTSKVKYMHNMFDNALAFNQNISSWNVSKVNSFSFMFSGAGNFNQNLGSWASTPYYNMSGMFDNSGMDCTNYSSTLAGWAAKATGSGTLGAKNLIYGTAGKVYRDQLIAKGWTISGDFYDDSCTGAVLSTSTAVTNKPLQVYPNPASDYFMLNAAAADTLTLLDQSGKIVKTQKLSAGQNTVHIDSLPKGLYIVKTNAKTAKLIKK